MLVRDNLIFLIIDLFCRLCFNYLLNNSDVRYNIKTKS